MFCTVVLAAAVLQGTSLPAAKAGVSEEDKMKKAEYRDLPLIDRNLPSRTERATFALG